MEAEKVHTADRHFPYTVWRLRVPGGWLYQVGATCPVFVPEETALPDRAVEHDVHFTALSNK